MRRLAPLVLLLVAADWPQFRGPGGSAAGTDADPPTTWAADGPKWVAELPGGGSSSPVVVGDRVYVTCYTGGGPAVVRHLVALDRATGRQVWADTVPGVPEEDAARGFLTDHGYASNTPAADATGVVAFFGKAGVAGYDGAGKRLWLTSVGVESDPRGWGSGASVLLWKRLVIVNAASEGRAVVALDRATGKEVWRAAGKKLALSFGTPALLTAGDRTDLVVPMPGEVWGLDPDTGKLRWHAAHTSQGNVSPSVAAGDGVAFLTGGFTGKATTAVRPGGEVLWTAKASSYVPTPLVHAGRLLWVGDDGMTVALDAATGKTLYSERLPGLGGGGRGGKPVYASPVRAGDRLYVVTRKAGTKVLAAGAEFKVLAENPPLDDTDFNATPAICGRELYLRSNRAVYRLDRPTEAGK